MPDNPEPAEKRLSSYPPEEYKKISGTYAIEEDSQILDMISRNDFSGYDLSKWDNVGVILNSFKTWKNLPDFIQSKIQWPLMRFIRNNLPITNEQLRRAIWDLATPLLTEYGLIVEVEEEPDRKKPGQYSVVDIRIITTRKSFREKVEAAVNQHDSEPPTMPETPRSKVGK